MITYVRIPQEHQNLWRHHGRKYENSDLKVQEIAFQAGGFCRGGMGMPLYLAPRLRQLHNLLVLRVSIIEQLQIENTVFSKITLIT